MLYRLYYGIGKTQGEDNQYYLNHTWKKEYNPVGAIYLDRQTDAGLNDFNTIIYGHRMRNLSMFGTLKYYADIQYWEEHPYVYLAVESGVYRYCVYNAYEAALDKNTYSINIADQNAKKDFFPIRGGTFSYQYRSNAGRR